MKKKRNTQKTSNRRKLNKFVTVFFLFIVAAIMAQMPPLDEKYAKLEENAPSSVKQKLNELRVKGKQENWTFQVGNTEVMGYDLNEITGQSLNLPGQDELEVHIIDPYNDSGSHFAKDKIVEWAKRESFDLRDMHLVTAPKFQGACGSNWAFTAISMLETAHLIRHKNNLMDMDLSEQYLINCTEGGDCVRGSLIKTWDDLTYPNGTIKEEISPYKASKMDCIIDEDFTPKLYGIESYKLIWGVFDKNTANEQREQIKNAICFYGSVSTSFRVSETFKLYAGGVFNAAIGEEEKATNHKAQIMGWDDSKNAWLIKNSWGTNWGENGFGWVNYDSLFIGGYCTAISAAIQVQITGDYDNIGGSTVGGNDKTKPGDGGDEKGKDNKGDKIKIPDPSTVKSISSRIDAAIYVNRHSYFFSGDQFFRFTRTSLDEEYPKKISNLPNTFKDGIDAALFYPPNGKIYLFKGDKYVRMSPPSNGNGGLGLEEGRDELMTNSESNNTIKNGFSVDSNYPRDLPGGWKGLPEGFRSGIDAAVYANGKTYFFKGNKYVRFLGTTIDPKYKIPKDLPGGWKIDDFFHKDIDAVFAFPEIKNRIYMFKGGKYIRLNLFRMEKDYPVDLPGGWKGFEN